MTLKIGQTISHFEILGPIGAGGMGEVYRARDTRLSREVALKVLPSELASEPEYRERFEREARTLAALNHPNIATIHGIEQDGDIHCLTLELVPGNGLDEFLREGPLPIPEALDVCRQIAVALQAAHDAGIVHRDLKPANVRRTPGGIVKVLDFGIAKRFRLDADAATSASEEPLTRLGAAIGTPPYMSPEQARGLNVDHRSDIWSFGCVLYECLTGERPFRGPTMADLLAEILGAEPDWTRLPDDTPAQVHELLRRCLAKEATDRPGDLTGAVSLNTHPLADQVALASGAESHPPLATDPDAADRAEGFWVAVLPFGCKGKRDELEALAEGMSEEIVAGLTRFSYLRVITHRSTQRYAGQSPDLRAVGQELGARYIMNGSLRLAGSRLRVAVQLVDAATGAQLWAETYERGFSSEAVFELQDELVPRIVSTVADIHGVLPYSMSEAVRLKSADEISPYEALLRSFGYNERFTPDDFAGVLDCLERAVEQAPGNADCQAMLSLMYANEYGHWGAPGPEPADRALRAARKAEAAAPLSSLAHYALAQALFFQRDFAAFRIAAERAVSLNPMDGATTAFMGLLIGYSGDWERGCALAERAWELNPNLPGVYHYTAWHDAYRSKDYHRAMDLALRINAPENFYTHAVLAMCHAQLGQMEQAGKAVRNLLALKPDYAEFARELHGRWIQPDLVEHMMDGLRKAGLDIAPAATESDS